MNNRVGLGTFPLASVFSKISKKDGEKLVYNFLNQGGYYIDTAPMYGFGEVELLLGRALKNFSREKYYIATKCGYIDVKGQTFQTIQKSGRYNDVLMECDRSLKRLGVEYVDLYLMHSPDPKTPIAETLGAMEKLQKDGKIKKIGVSNVNIFELKEYNQSGKVRFVQNRFSLINRSIDNELASYMLNNAIKLMPYQVIDRGQLTGSVLDDIDLNKDDLRMGRSDWLPQVYGVISEWSKENLLPIAKKIGITLGQLSMPWALHQKYMGFLIVGLTKPGYIPINLKANSIVLSDEIISEVDSAYAKLEKKVWDKYKVSVREFRGLNEKYY